MNIVRRRPILTGVLALGLLAVGLCGVYGALAVYKAYDYTRTPEQPPITATPGDIGLTWEDITFPSADGDQLELRGWWVPSAGSRRVVILVHGRYENRATHLALARPLHDAGFNVLLFDLRGHGESSSAPCGYGLRERWDVSGAVAWARGRGFEAGSIGIIGWSLGAASALMALEETPDIAVVSDSAYADGEPLLARNALRPGLRLALRLFRGVDLDAVRPDRSIATAGERRVLLIHGALDTAVPVSHAERLRAAGGASVSDLWVVPDAGHTGAYAVHPDEYAARVIVFFNAELEGSVSR